MTLDYEPGGTLVLAHAGSCAVAFGADASVDAEAIWAALTAPEPIRAVLDVLTHEGLGSTPAFALVDWSGSWSDRATVVVRGSIAVTITSGSSETRIDGTDVATWRELAFERASVIAVGIPAGGPTLPLIGGVVNATSARLRAEVDAAEAPVAVVVPNVAPEPQAAPAAASVPENTITELVEETPAVAVV